MCHRVSGLRARRAARNEIMMVEQPGRRRRKIRQPIGIPANACKPGLLLVRQRFMAWNLICAPYGESEFRCLRGPPL